MIELQLIKLQNSISTPICNSPHCSMKMPCNVYHICPIMYVIIQKQNDVINFRSFPVFGQLYIIFLSWELIKLLCLRNNLHVLGLIYKILLNYFNITFQYIVFKIISINSFRYLLGNNIWKYYRYILTQII